ncbi:DUF4064 domain-containing protein [Ornithinibacillus salinisoli]|uniref:DUF4064 domain-containing protein n=1 Tax=Ornithinibacillus salinisoli TaxID=1848459 RepID=A0ABW4VX46_9BACI
MSRTFEMILSIIGVLIYFCLLVVGIGLVWFLNNNSLLEKILGDSLQLELGVYMTDVIEFINMFSTGGWLLIIVMGIPLVLGIVCLFLIKGNNKPKPAGIILISTAFFSVVFSFWIGAVGGFFYLIAGLLCLTRIQR